MRIQRVVLRNHKALRSRDDSFDLPSGEAVSEAVCLRGVNGSGKTTYLLALVELWEQLRRYIKQGPAGRDSLDLRHFGDSYIGVQLTGLPGPIPSLWVQYGEVSYASPPPGWVLHLGGTFTWKPREIGGTSIRPVRPYLSPNPVVMGPDAGPEPEDAGQEFRAFWGQQLNALQLAGLAEKQAQPLPNVLYLGAEDRYITPLGREEDLSEPAAEDAFRWLARYQPTRDKRQHIENSITALRLVNPTRFAEIRERIHAVLPNVELLDQSHSHTLRPLVRVRNGAITTLDALSAGERAAFIALFHVARWLTPGGVVLIDEPELHQHLSLMRINLSALHRFVVKKMGGQLIVASHAAEVWEHFRHSYRLIDLDDPSGPEPSAE